MNDLVNKRNDSITRLVLFLTYRCNFNCSYCYVKKKETKELGDKELIGVIKELKVKNNKLKEINFMGGEPLLKLGTIKRIINEFKGEFIYSLNTNGYLLDKETLDFFLENKVTIVLSLDGSEKTHGLNRKNKTFNKIIKKIKGYKGKLIINYVIHKNSIANLIGDFNNLVLYGFKTIDVRPNSDYLWNKGELKKLNENVLKFYRLYFGIHRNNGVKVILDKVVSNICFYENEKGCNELKLSPNGHFFSCCRLCNVCESKEMEFGRKIFDSKKRDNFLLFARKKIRLVRERMGCDECILKERCLCMIDNFYLYKDNFNAWFDAYCKINKIMIGNLFRARFLPPTEKAEMPRILIQGG